MLGVYARVDRDRGVWKASANEPVRGADDLEYRINDRQQDVLNPRGVNVIRHPGRGIRVWGARTLASDPGGNVSACAAISSSSSDPSTGASNGSSSSPTASRSGRR